jgi:hypothetical protein
MPFFLRTGVRYRNATPPFALQISHSWRPPRIRHERTAADGARAPTDRRAIPNHPEQQIEDIAHPHHPPLPSGSTSRKKTRGRR